MKLAYADPPYVGCSSYYDHPDAKRWDDPDEQIELMCSLHRDYDGWAFSSHLPGLRHLLPHAPAKARIGAWVKPFAAYKANVRIAYTWEPVLFVPGRDSSKDGAPVGRDHLSHIITMQKGLVGAKPEAFCRWVLDLMGYVQGDEVVDLFPGTGVMGRVLTQSSLVLATDGREGS